jgi:hypothetical protein
MQRDADRDWDDEHDDDADWDELADGEDGEPTVACRYCGEEIHEESVRCPHCERYLSDEDAPPSPKPWWIIIGAALGLYAAYRWTVG